jgi:hypothetical protein
MSTKKKTTPYNVGIPGLGLGRAQRCGEVKPVSGIKIVFYIKFYDIF